MLVSVASSNQEIVLNENKGTGAGGANTNYHGKLFEHKTNNQPNLLNEGYEIYEFSSSATKNKKQFKCLMKNFTDKTIYFTTQNGLKQFMKQKYNIELFRCPDEAYIIECNPKKIIKIIEKKEQHVEGSVETKLWSGPSLKREYELVLGDEFNVQYGFVVNHFLQKKMTSNEKKYVILNEILKENKIDVLFGDDDEYFETLKYWINETTESRSNGDNIER